MFHSARDRAVYVTDGWMCGSPRRVISVLLTLYSYEPNVFGAKHVNDLQGRIGNKLHAETSRSGLRRTQASTVTTQMVLMTAVGGHTRRAIESVNTAFAKDVGRKITDDSGYDAMFVGVRKEDGELAHDARRLYHDELQPRGQWCHDPSCFLLPSPFGPSSFSYHPHLLPPSFPLCTRTRRTIWPSRRVTHDAFCRARRVSPPTYASSSAGLLYTHAQRVLTDRRPFSYVHDAPLRVYALPRFCMRHQSTRSSPPPSISFLQSTRLFWRATCISRCHPVSAARHYLVRRTKRGLREHEDIVFSQKINAN